MFFKLVIKITLIMNYAKNTVLIQLPFFSGYTIMKMFAGFIYLILSREPHEMYLKINTMKNPRSKHHWHFFFVCDILITVLWSPVKIW